MDVRRAAVIVLISGIAVAAVGFVFLIQHEPTQHELRFDTVYSDGDGPSTIVSNGSYYRLVFGGTAEYVKWTVTDGDRTETSFSASPVYELAPGTYTITCTAFQDGFSKDSSAVLTVEDDSYLDLFGEYDTETALFTVSSILIILATSFLEVGSRR